MANPVSQADIFQSMPRMYDTVASQSGGPGAEIEADRILLVHELGHAMASERFFTRRAALSSGAIAQSTSFAAARADFANGPFRMSDVLVWLASPSVAADWSLLTVSLRNAADPTTEIPIWTWNAAAGTTILCRASMGGGAAADNIVLLNQLPNAPSSWLLNGSQSTPSSNVFDGISFRGTTAAYGAGTRTATVEVRIASMSNQGLPGSVGSYGLPLNW